jgi:hypothetical protein
MTIVLFFLFFYLIVTGLDLAHINSLLARKINGGPAHASKPVEPAPRLVINLPPANRPPSS